MAEENTSLENHLPQMVVSRCWHASIPKVSARLISGKNRIIKDVIDDNTVLYVSSLAVIKLGC
ncbi:unnamed protein product [Sphenostylis stenocarpa]|uniref:Uncharacterized protein n=1 Tax=Sphenostylis stenocarpa TaxID=92480 RepID=A0AA86RLD4_9FABA|nr:unnamed protein product [Sphenostylis stenocarpa]